MTDNQLHESFKQFSDLYKCTVEHNTKEVSIKMTVDEYERFLQNWANYIDIMYVTKYNPIVRDEFEKVIILTNLMR